MEDNKNLWILVLIVAALLLLFGSFGMGGTGSYGMMSSGGMMNLMGGGIMGFGFLFMLLFWGLIIWIAVTFINGFSTSKDENSLDIIKKRYAKGEITKKQYEQMKKEIS
ncbi:SHOCT domain-containing protein [Candidatus Woesearchaeota archaeon]|nr:SHOCT domain-containing protein [Candidatus Woesearchaeota archaeon]